MSRRSFEAFCEKFDEIKRRGLNNWDAFEEANKNMPTYKDAESFINTRSYHRRKKREK
jgi:23S rRNA maturation mini-RNase III